MHSRLAFFAGDLYIRDAGEEVGPSQCKHHYCVSGSVDANCRIQHVVSGDRQVALPGNFGFQNTSTHCRHDREEGNSRPLSAPLLNNRVETRPELSIREDNVLHTIIIGM